MYAKEMNSFRRAERARMTLSAHLVKGDKVLETETINISDTGALLKKPAQKNLLFSVGELMQLHIHGYIKEDSLQTSVYPVIFVRSEDDTIALEFL